ncbi:hypothetical protein [Desulfosporosinus sp. BG]|uniref:hypothetical protein n=1 Tax=Desulfosporosinus sp. BG TaxID=1633135 RepID=UPI00083B506A|nr:hypothetical protein [Desulfosporosinus sp. BG]ODA40905.1 hypothetical protein DSBG_2346 [Desulfosporosinus sp. BG]
MKRWITLPSVILALVLFGCVACAKTTALPLSKVVSEDQSKISEREKATGDSLAEDINHSEDSRPLAVVEQQANEMNESSAIIPKSNNINTDTPKQQTLNESNGGITIITKSDNVYTDAQKIQTLNELTGEIDKLIESLKSLEDVQYLELTFD